MNTKEIGDGDGNSEFNNDTVFVTMMNLAKDPGLFPECNDLLARTLKFEQWMLICDASAPLSKMWVIALETSAILAETLEQWVEVLYRAERFKFDVYKLYLRVDKEILSLIKTFDDCKLVHRRVGLFAPHFAKRMGELTITLDQCVYLYLAMDSRFIFAWVRERTLEKIYRLAKKSDQWLYIYTESYMYLGNDLGDIALEKIRLGVNTYKKWMKVAEVVKNVDPRCALAGVAESQAYKLARTPNQKKLVHQAQ